MIPNEESPTMLASEIAGLLGWKTVWFRRQLKKLVSEHGMPAALPGGRWHRATIMRWLDRYGELKARAAGRDMAKIRIDIDREALLAKYAPDNQRSAA
jgi:hypothetical protein